VLEAIDGKAGTAGSITLGDFSEYVDRRVIELTQDQQHPFPFVLDFSLGTPLFTQVAGGGGGVRCVAQCVGALGDRPGRHHRRSSAGSGVPVGDAAN
jgi:hypothetical protein